MSHWESFSLGREGQIIGIMTHTVLVGLQIYHGTLLASYFMLCPLLAAFTHIFYIILKINPVKLCILILYIKKLVLGKYKSFSQGHRANKRPSHL